MPFDGPLTYSKSNGAREGVVVMTLEGPLTLRNIFAFQKDLTIDPPLVPVACRTCCCTKPSGNSCRSRIS